MPRTPEQYEEIRVRKKQIIMNAALELFANDGFHATSISKIADKANISKGLLYNYFPSKEKLLISIFQQISEEIIDMMNPDHDDEITTEEAENFFDLYFDMLKKNINTQKLYYQLTMQTEVLDFVQHSVLAHKSLEHQTLLYNYFDKINPKNANNNVLLLSSALKGFTAMYVFNPGDFPDQMIEDFKGHLKQIFIYNIKNETL